MLPFRLFRRTKTTGLGLATAVTPATAKEVRPLRKILTAVALIGTAACSDSATGPTTTRSDTFEISVSQGTNVPWSHEVDLGPGSWSSAEVLNCREVRPSAQSWACDSYTLQLSGSVMMFSGTKVNQFARVIRVTWEATGSV